MSNTIIQVENLGKKYLIKHQQQVSYNALRDVITDKVKSFGKKIISPWNHKQSSIYSRTEEFWALKDVSFKVKQGDVIGIVGRNGAGKSTLLKIISRITEPTEGRIRIKGRVASLLEVGTGFHPELTGRENIFLNGAILGMGKVEIKRKFDEIVAFAEIEKFLDTPVKRYSSGMYVRLAFAVAAHLEPEILLVDEVLAVGDTAFQKKCLGKMEDVAKGGRTVLFVSHNIAAIRSLCPFVMLLRSGNLIKSGNAEEIITEYLRIEGNYSGGERTWPDIANAPGDEDIRIRALRIKNSSGDLSSVVRIDENMSIEIEYEVLLPLRDARLGFHLMTSDGTIVLSSGDGDACKETLMREPGIYTSRFLIPQSFLNSGTYVVKLSGHIPGVKLFFSSEEILLPFAVLQTTDIGGHGRRPGVIRPLIESQILKADD